MPGERLNVIALISGGKDSFYSLLHCMHHGHRIVALANLFPNVDGNQSSEVQVIRPDQPVDSSSSTPAENDASEDLNSFMYQTVGHEVLPLFAQATGLPLYRQPILGSAVRHERDYDYTLDEQGSAPAGDETESMLPLLRAVKAHHPEANALCSGAILSTYQRTRVESVALRLGLTPLSYLWKYPVLPPLHGGAVDEAQLLRDMAAVGLEARIIKVASAGLDETHLWERLTSETGVDRIKASLRRFGVSDGASIGEGGEFETLVVDGPAALFQKRISVPENGRMVIPDGGGSFWLMLRGAHLQDKLDSAEQVAHLSVREPGLLDARFQTVSQSLQSSSISYKDDAAMNTSKLINKSLVQANLDIDNIYWAVIADSHPIGKSIQHEMINVAQKIQSLLSSKGLESSAITSAIIILRDMSDFLKINEEYGKLFQKPNPPSRITISSGDLVPEGRNVVIYLTVPVSNSKVIRSGLHVQSRSYWAPANIGPYSQAVETAVTENGEPTNLRVVRIAGQIPLIPASMVLPTPSETALQDQAVLSLQHLWRIGSDMKVQFWTSAVAYIARQPSEGSARESAKLAGKLWLLAHGSPDDEDEDEEDGPDPWELKHNMQYQSLGEGEACAPRASVPHWSIFTLSQQNEPTTCIPPVFAAEIESLPRGSLVEWHAHAGLKGIEENSAELVRHASIRNGRWMAWHLVVKSHATVLYTTMAYSQDDHSGATKFQALEQELSIAYKESLGELQPGVTIPDRVVPYLGYVNMNKVGELWTRSDSGVLPPFAVVPCHSLWSSIGDRLGLVALYETILTTGNEE
ncbi:hypothetical protein QQS21_005531 [Conoideocrella luteorostrata]|uniref:Diphthine--ammonia ligase n=1 Tax=Conoideocrella luteorostrata TaxID=1105319 RepID=A0AAJ0CPK8_9HYPO|nr:hypothetical protein QQS21_005531 [Conoideocrella luteorostrata]